MTAGHLNRSAAEFALFSAAFLIPALAWVYLPVLAVLAALVMPVPLALLVRRQDLRRGLVALLLLLAVLSAVTLKPYLALVIVMQTGPLGLLLGLLFKNHVSSGKTLVTAVAFSLVLALGMFLFTYLLTGSSPFTLNERQSYVFDQERRLLTQMFGQGGTTGELDPDTLREMQSAIDQVEVLWPVISASSVLIWFMASAALSCRITRRVMIRYGHSVPAPLPFSRLRLPWYTIWGVIAGLALLLGGDQAGSPGLATAGKVLLLVTGFLLAAIGGSVHAHYLQRWKVAWPFKLISLIILAVYLPLTLMVLATTGVIDCIWNIRRLTPDGRTPEEEDKK